MKDNDHEGLQKTLQDTFPPVNSELSRDLWPLMLRRLNSSGPVLPWYDWALIGGSAGVLLFFPRLMLLFAYHL
jgi:hypothetical protein